MSFITGTSTELIYESTAVATAKASFTTEAVINDTAGMGPQPVLPPYFWLPSGAIARSILIQAEGILSSTATPTYTFAIRLGAANSTAGPLILGSAALTTGSGVTNQFWKLEGVVSLITAGATGGNSTVRGTGMIWCGGLASPFMYSLYGGAASPGTVATVDISTTNYLNFDVACSASSASNSIQLQALRLFGLN